MNNRMNEWTNVNGSMNEWTNYLKNVNKWIKIQFRYYN